MESGCLLSKFSLLLVYRAVPKGVCDPPSPQTLSAKLPIGKMRKGQWRSYVGAWGHSVSYWYWCMFFSLYVFRLLYYFLRLIVKLKSVFFCLSLFAAQIFRGSTFWQNLLWKKWRGAIDKLTSCRQIETLTPPEKKSPSNAPVSVSC